MSYIQIASWMRGNREIVSVPVPKAMQTKYDNMIDKGIHVVLLPNAIHGVDVAITSDAIQLEQRFCAYEEADMIKAITDAINFADVPKLLKIKKANLDALDPARRIQ